MRYDVMIIGAGPGGYTAANRAAAAGLKTVIFEKNKVGGTCLNRGCIPMKSLLASADVYDLKESGAVFGVDCSQITFDYPSINRRRDEVVAALRGGVEKSLRSNKVELVYGQASITGRNAVSCNGTTYEGDNIIIAAGSIPAIIPIEGNELAITSDDILEKEFELPDSLIIIGGGVIGVEMADALSSFGCKVTIVELADQLLPGMDKDIGQRLAMFFKKKDIGIYCSASVTKIYQDNEGKGVLFTNKDGSQADVKAAEVLLATGRRADVSKIFAEDIGIEVNRGIRADQEGRTAIDDIYVIGDAKAGNIQLAHVAQAQGENVVDLILKRRQRNDTATVPSCIYTRPNIASVGMSQDELKEKGIEYKAYRFLTGANGKCLIENAQSGFVRILTVDDVIVGGQMIAPHATELIGELAIAVSRRMSVEEFAGIIHPHPTVSEMLKDCL